MLMRDEFIKNTKEMSGGCCDGSLRGVANQEIAFSVKTKRQYQSKVVLNKALKLY